jgi:hypothetical protein
MPTLMKATLTIGNTTAGAHYTLCACSHRSLAPRPPPALIVDQRSRLHSDRYKGTASLPTNGTRAGFEFETPFVAAGPTHVIHDPHPILSSMAVCESSAPPRPRRAPTHLSGGCVVAVTHAHGRPLKTFGGTLPPRVPHPPLPALRI